MRIVRGFWSILLVLAGCGRAPPARLVDRISAEDELYAMATREVLDEPRIPARYDLGQDDMLYCLDLHGRSPHPAVLARFASHPVRVGPRTACAPSGWHPLPEGGEALSLPLKFDAIDWSDPEKPLVHAVLPVITGYEGFELEMRFSRDGERWRVSHRSLEFYSCTENERLW
ncbi:hypothetical protein BO221_08545 [Archangium sp. Cb G35]|uniref:hypothetical protein n=1 Tax=Archangium sp. Cb G35 TaxID=1920190 RepID=UPI000935F368|nr:hypothetical protein [Archangium sp. Cb G35]OJT25878.1 hypothetical protein BO221_08545 [Archangium sp. Cb G35]